MDCAKIGISDLGAKMAGVDIKYTITFAHKPARVSL